MTEHKIRVVIADDSAFMRKRLVEIISSASDMEIVAVARNGREAIEAAHSLNPDVITMDIQMPVMDGIEALGYIMSEVPTPCIVISAFATDGSEKTLRALEFGAIDFVTKPSGVISKDIDMVAEEIIEKIRLAAQVPAWRLRLVYPVERMAPKPSTVLLPELKKIFVVASSTGGTQALATLLPMLKRDMPAAVLVVQHMPEGFTKGLAQRLDRISNVTVKEAEDGMRLVAGEVIIAKGGSHLELEGSFDSPCVKLGDGAPVMGLRPNANVTFSSVARLFRERTVGIVLTGMGSDGTAGSREIKTAGGFVIAQDEASSIIYGMPKSVVQAKLADKVVPLLKISEEMERLLR